jgi:hypothetical protein
LFNAPVGQIFPISPRFETQWAAVSSAGPREIASSASFWLLLKRAPRLVNPTFNQIVRRLCRYCYDVPFRGFVAVQKIKINPTEILKI